MENEETRKALNQFAREQTKQHLLADILFDLNVCKLEGWDYKEYINELMELISGIVKSNDQKKAY